jgi:hypothetical protein
MGKCCSSLNCDTDESSISCPFGSVKIKHCACGCFKTKEDDEQKRQLEIAIRVKLRAYEFEIRRDIKNEEQKTLAPTN